MIYYDTTRGISHVAYQVGGISFAIETLCGGNIKLYTDKENINRSFYSGDEERVTCKECQKKLKNKTAE